MSWSLTCVGAGSAFNTVDFQSNFLIQAKSGKKLLIDCGSMAPIALEKLGIHGGNVGEEIDAVYISHLHADHIGGLEWLAFCTYFNPKAPKPKLFCVTGLLRDLWNKSLRGGLGSIQTKECTLTDYFEGHPVKINESFTWENLNFTPVQTVHIMNGMEIVSSYGLLITEVLERMAIGPAFVTDEHVVTGPTVFLTTDSQFCPHQIMDFYNKADVILHDCETAPFKSGVHAHYNDLITLPEETKKKMWLYHYQPDPPVNELEIDGFLGFLQRGQVLEFGPAKE